MERLTTWDPINKVYKAKSGTECRSIIQELGIYETIHEKEIHNAANIGDIRDHYITNAAKLDPYWENFGKKEEKARKEIPCEKCIYRRRQRQGDFIIIYCNKNKNGVVKDLKDCKYFNEAESEDKA